MEWKLNEQMVTGRQRKLRLAASFFILLMILFTLFSNTLLALTTPKAVLTVPSRGELVHHFTGSGIVNRKAEAALTNPAGWKATKVTVKKGDHVTKGQSLVTYDKQDAEQQILDEQANLKKLKLSNEEQKSNYIEAAQSGDEQSMKSAKRALDIGAIDVDMQERRIQRLQNDLHENSELLAPFDGVVTEVNAAEGLPSSGSPDIRISNTSLGFESEFLVPADSAVQLKIGDKLKVQVKGDEGLTVEGQVEQIQDGDSGLQGSTDPGGGAAVNVPMKKLQVALHDNALKGGESVKVELTQMTDDMILVPNQAIRDEGGKKYVYGVEEQDGPLGNTFYVRKIFITAADSNESVTAVSEGLFEQQEVILESSEPLREGDKIRIH
ncbi:efflux RND transporter periplasmic adaptor subunit [Paenibacillus harenae]|uniref:efflux RND transporter periplasmic adaptor subunit n=1 Tax=Paenibacillus harenae TaxID=306543 RepID=UPI0004137F82|nr:HlyD family efflux transporter periplasmic adaptor subunit [Paenibacillus harenae]